MYHLPEISNNKDNVQLGDVKAYTGIMYKNGRTFISNNDRHTRHSLCYVTSYIQCLGALSMQLILMLLS